MRNRVIRSFIIAQALVGLVLTIFWIAGQWPSRSMGIPLFAIAAVSAVLAFVPCAWVSSGKRDNESNAAPTTEHTLPATRNLERHSIGGMNPYSRDFVLIAAFLTITALLLRFVAPVPGI